MNAQIKKVLFIAALLVGIVAANQILFTDLYLQLVNSSRLLLSNMKSIGLALPTAANNKVVIETDVPENSNDLYWWLDSGGLLRFENGVGKTVQGSLSTKDYWYAVYASTNPIDTDGGGKPQNIFRLVTRNKWLNFSQSVYFKVNADNLSRSPNRNESNGIFLFSRYQDAENLYYAGLRVDGSVVIKKKYREEYYTLAIIPFLPGVYDRRNNPSLIPKDSWIGLKMETNNLDGNKVDIKLCIDIERTGKWNCLIDVIDKREKSVPPITAEGSAGIRTDFMDVEFLDYSVEPIAL